jgi:probable rRNA maturation factor
MASAVILNRQRKYPIPVERLEKFALRLCQRLRIPDSEFTVLLTGDRSIRLFNRNFRKRDKATDVLSFPAARRQRTGGHFENHYIGDMIISVETAQQQAIERIHSLETEIRILMIHGLLHLLGHDHETDQGQMRRKELKLQRELL